MNSRQMPQGGSTYNPGGGGDKVVFGHVASLHEHLGGENRKATTRRPNTKLGQISMRLLQS